MKAGLMEIADILVINKSDRDGAEQIARQTRAMFEMRDERNGWDPPVILTIAFQGDGIPELYEHIEKHHRFLSEAGLLGKHRQANVEATIKAIVEGDLHSKIWNEGTLGRLEGLVADVMGGRVTPRQASEVILKMIEGR